MPRRKVNVEEKILSAIGPQGATWSEIYEKAGVSKGALSAHLRRLMRAGAVKRVVDPSTMPPQVRYYKSHAIRNPLLESFPHIHFTLADFKKEIRVDFYEEDKKIAEDLPCEIYIYLDEEKRNKLDAINNMLMNEKKLGFLAAEFIDLIRQTMMKCIGKEWDFEVTLVIHFDGRDLKDR